MRIVKDPVNLLAHPSIHIQNTEGARMASATSLHSKPSMSSLQDHTYFLTLNANSGRLRISATQYPLIRNKKVRKP